MKGKFLAIAFDYYGNRTYKKFTTIKKFCDTYGIKVDDEYRITTTHNDKKNWQGEGYLTIIAVMDLSTLEELFSVDFITGDFDELYNYLADYDDIDKYITKK